LFHQPISDAGAARPTACGGCAASDRGWPQLSRATWRRTCWRGASAVSGRGRGPALSVRELTRRGARSVRVTGEVRWQTYDPMAHFGAVAGGRDEVGLGQPPVERQTVGHRTRQVPWWWSTTARAMVDLGERGSARPHVPVLHHHPVRATCADGNSVASMPANHQVVVQCGGQGRPRAEQEGRGAAPISVPPR